MEKKEAQILEKIKLTQNIQLEEFNKLEEAMFEQQLSVKKRLQGSPNLSMQLDKNSSTVSMPYGGNPVQSTNPN